MPKQLSFATARRILLSIWFSFFLAGLACIFYLYLDNWIEEEDFRAALQQLNSLYVTYLGTIVTFFLTKSAAAHTTRRRAGAPFIIAVVGSVLWNVVIFAFIFRLVLQIGTFEGSMRQIGFIGPLLSWLVAPAIGFYFAGLPPSKD